jgi:hypothetical protein
MLMGGGAPSLPAMVAGDFIADALPEELEERKAALPARNGSSAVVGLAAHSVSSRTEGVSARRRRTSQGH